MTLVLEHAGAVEVEVIADTNSPAR
jgi:hypothetical protein